MLKIVLVCLTLIFYVILIANNTKNMFAKETSKTKSNFIACLKNKPRNVV